MEKTLEDSQSEHQADANSEKAEANTCIALGAGVGVLGACAAMAAGALCPICVVVAPGLIGAGLIKRWKMQKNERKN